MNNAIVLPAKPLIFSTWLVFGSQLHTRGVSGKEMHGCLCHGVLVGRLDFTDEEHWEIVLYADKLGVVDSRLLLNPLVIMISVDLDCDRWNAKLWLIFQGTRRA
jgi:hypothetical protein